MARSNGRYVKNTDWTAIWIAVVLSITVMSASFILDHGQSARLDRLEKDNALQQAMIKELGQKVAR